MHALQANENVCSRTYHSRDHAMRDEDESETGLKKERISIDIAIKRVSNQ